MIIIILTYFFLENLLNVIFTKLFNLFFLIRFFYLIITFLFILYQKYLNLYLLKNSYYYFIAKVLRFNYLKFFK